MANTKQNVNNPVSVNMSRAEQRLMDFLQPRLAMPTTSPADRKSRDLKAVSDTLPVISPAAKRLQQLLLFRQRQQESATQAAHARLLGERDVAVSGQLNWVPIGPAGVERGQASDGPIVSGRVKAIAAAPGGIRVYLATANGGVWYSGDTGKNWRPLMDKENFDPSPTSPTPSGSDNSTDSLACGAIALVPGNGNSSDRIYLGTGEGDGMTDAYLGVGPLVSFNGGASWVRETVTSGNLIGQGFYGMVVDPDDSERVVAATSDGIYMRIPGAGNWERKKFSTQRVTGLAVAKGKGVKRYFAAIQGDKVYASSDGENWGAIDNGFPTVRVGRISLAANPHNPNVIYAQVAFGGFATTPSAVEPEYGNLDGVYRLDYGIDEKWYKVTGVPTTVFGSDPAKAGQGNYDNAITVAPDNENRIYIGGSGKGPGSTFSATVYRCDITLTQAPGTVTLNAVAEFVGAAVHADVHAISFVPNDPQKLWVGSDGGAYFTNQGATGTGVIFQSKNRGLQTLTINNLDKHPTEEEILFCGAQDNGGLRYVGEAIWLHSSYGDGGYYVVNWNDPTKVISSYNKNHLRTNSLSGNRAAPPDVDYSNEIPVDVQPLEATENVRFYAPLSGTPVNTAFPTEANILAFGTRRPWISTDFGANWLPLPSLTAGDAAKYNTDISHIGPGTDPISNRPFTIRSLTFADSKTLLAGTENGRVLRYIDGSAANDWSSVAAPTRLDNATGGAIAANHITDIVVVPGNPNQFYISVGGSTGNNQHVWFYDEAANPKWSARGGTVLKSLLDIHFSTLAINPENVNQIFAGSDVGIWKSDNGGAEWEPFSNNLPETAVIDLLFSTRDLGGGNKLLLLRASTYGRGVFECNLSPGIASTPDVELYLRDNVLDRGRFTTRLAVDDYTNPGTPIPDVQSPDIKIDVPDASGVYQFPAQEQPSPGQFSLGLTDESDKIPVSATGTTVSRVYVQVNSRGIQSANNIQVMLLIAELSGGTEPDLPANYHTDLQAGIPINRDGWKTVGIKMAQGVRAGFSQVLSFDLPSTLLPAHGTLGGGKELVLVALLHHPLDVYSVDGRVLNPTDAASVARSERKISFRRIKAIQSPEILVTDIPHLPLNNFISIPASATAPEAPYDAFLAQAFRINDGLFNDLMLSRFAQPFSNRGTDGVLTNPDVKSLVFAETITVDTDVTLQAGTPLIWFARKKITISKSINAKGLGAARADDGDFGGAGGGGASSAGKKCSLPRSNPAIDIATGGATGNNVGSNLDASWATRALLQLTFCKGAGAGGDDGANLGGLGGGIVILCAPSIEFSGDGKIDATGGNGAGNAGGGGGGLIVLVAVETINLNDSGPSQNVLIAGGTSSGSGGAGGTGMLLRKTFQ